MASVGGSKNQLSLFLVLKTNLSLSQEMEVEEHGSPYYQEVQAEQAPIHGQVAVGVQLVLNQDLVEVVVEQESHLVRQAVEAVVEQELHLVRQAVEAVVEQEPHLVRQAVEAVVVVEDEKRDHLLVHCLQNQQAVQEVIVEKRKKALPHGPLEVDKARESDWVSLSITDWLGSFMVVGIGFTESTEGLRSETSSNIESTDERSSSKNSGTLAFSESRKSRLSAMLDELFSSSESIGDP
ncbi:prolipoprotein diacylglyceryl transferase [Striga asiatica]|uniref:Prolipoprotein diacylglyceryl transferase n=1 Tax=Striga asiatica TaxID=4170 RepID=A0A5A7P1U8_STRAF|nr:prolipoprotein diacylglyceryl transferase [Striga asiatica]